MENFKEIPGTDGLYLISRLGVVWSNKTNRTMRVYYCGPGKKGSRGSQYAFVKLSIGNRVVLRDLHRLVALAHCPNPDLLPVVNHKNGIKVDVWAGNLEWTTYSGNSKHAIRTGLTPLPPTMKGKFGAAHNRSIAAYAYKLDGSLVGLFGSIAEAARETNNEVTAVHHAIVSKAVTRKGLIYSYCELTIADIEKIKADVRDLRIAGQKKSAKRILAFALDGTQTGSYLGQVEAAKETGVPVHGIMDSLRFGRFNKSSGIRFVYAAPRNCRF